MHCARSSHYTVLHVTLYRTSAYATRTICASLLLLASLSAQATLFEQVDVSTNSAGETEIAIRFDTTVQYQRHQPPGAGNLLKIEVQITGATDRAEGRLVSELRRHPGNGAVAPFEVSYDSASSFITIKFSRFTNFRAGPGADPRSILVVVPGAKPVAPAKAPAPAAISPQPSAPTLTAPAAPASVEALARQSLTEAKQALAEKRAVNAIDLLNRVLNLPPTSSAEEAQALIGEARELNGETSRAKAEYELFLKLFPAAPNTEKIKARLAAISSNSTATKSGGKSAEPVKPEYSFYGSVSSYYYRGSTKYDATLAPPIPGLQFDQISLTSTDQSALVTNIDLNGRYRSGSWDSKISVRDTNSQSFISNQRDYNRLNNAYVETTNKAVDFFARVGRQSSPGYGVLGRYDGLWLRYGFDKSARVGIVAGEPVEFYPAPKKRFAGAAFDWGPFAESFSGNLFAVEQRVDGLQDRRGLGAELRYLDPKKNAFAVIDYDPTGKVLNTLLVQGNWQIIESSGINLLYDRRRSPTLQLTNGLFALPSRTVRENIDTGLTEDEIRAAALGVTPLSTLVSLGATHQFSPAWQLSGDVKYSEVSGTGAVGTLPAQPGTGKIWVYGAQGIRNGVFLTNDILVASVNIIRGRTYRGESAQLSHVLLLAEKWRIETALKYYHQVDSRDNTLNRYAPNVRVNYRVLERLSVEGEAGAERSTTRGPLIADKTTRRFFNLGLRYDFF
jgi:hypothetical protein